LGRGPTLAGTSHSCCVRTLPRPAPSPSLGLPAYPQAKMTRHRPMPKCKGPAVQTNDRRRGVVLVSVLWTMALLSALAMAAGLPFRGFAGLLSAEHARLQVAALQTAGLEIAAGLVASLGDRPVGDIATVITLSTGSVHLLITDDGGRIDVGKAPEEVLAGLFRGIGAPQAHAGDVSHAI